MFGTFIGFTAKLNILALQAKFRPAVCLQTINFQNLPPSQLQNIVRMALYGLYDHFSITNIINYRCIYLPEHPINCC